MINSADLMGMVLQITSKLSVVQAVSVFNLTFLGKNLWRQGRNPLSLFLKESGFFLKIRAKGKTSTSLKAYVLAAQKKNTRRVPMKLLRKELLHKTTPD